jgi:uncharacterized protein (DUF983 family)
MKATQEKPEPLHSMEPDWRVFNKRGWRLRCPECGIARVFRPWKECHSLRDWSEPLEGCPICGYKYEREPGYFLLSMFALNYGVTGAFGVATMFLIDGYFHPPVWQTIAMVAPVLIVMSLLLIRHSKSLFLAMDHYFDPHVKPGSPGSLPASEPKERKHQS